MGLVCNTRTFVFLFIAGTNDGEDGAAPSDSTPGTAFDDADDSDDSDAEGESIVTWPCEAEEAKCKNCYCNELYVAGLLLNDPQYCLKYLNAFTLQQLTTSMGAISVVIVNAVLRVTLNPKPPKP